MSRDHVAHSDADQFELNKARKNATIQKDLQGTGRWALSIPHTHVDNRGWPACLCEQCLYKAKPDLASPDRQTQNKAWLAFIKHSDSVPYRVRDKL